MGLGRMSTTRITRCAILTFVNIRSVILQRFNSAMSAESAIAPKFGVYFQGAYLQGLQRMKSRQYGVWTDSPGSNLIVHIWPSRTSGQMEPELGHGEMETSTNACTDSSEGLQNNSNATGSGGILSASPEKRPHTTKLSRKFRATTRMPNHLSA